MMRSSKDFKWLSAYNSQKKVVVFITTHDKISDLVGLVILWGA